LIEYYYSYPIHQNKIDHSVGLMSLNKELGSSSIAAKCNSATFSWN